MTLVRAAAPSVVLSKARSVFCAYTLAQRSRVRKKFLLESLQRSVDALQAENDSLKDSIREHMGPQGEALVEKCTPAPDSLLTSNPMRASRILDDPDYSLVKALQTAQQNFVITDANLPDNPIVYASGGFLTLTGYKLNQILGRNCRYLKRHPAMYHKMLRYHQFSATDCSLVLAAVYTRIAPQYAYNWTLGVMCYTMVYAQVFAGS